jgi:hypothetical protein
MGNPGIKAVYDRYYTDPTFGELIDYTPPAKNY